MIVAGGVYLERCVTPRSETMLGSGGRASLALRGHAATELHTFHPDPEDVRANFGGDAVVHAVDRMLTFDYLHPLARPRIAPVPLPRGGTAEVEGEVVLRFGCLEGDFRVDARVAVYDPQNGAGSLPFDANGSRAERLALVLNAGEAGALALVDDAAEAGRRLLRRPGVEAVIVKEGAAGALVVQREALRRVPAYRTTSLYKIGSGDVFTAMFAFHWAVRGRDAAEAADAASRQVAAYVSSRVLPCPTSLPNGEPVSGGLRGRIVLVAVDGDDVSARWLASAANEALLDLGAARVLLRHAASPIQAHGSEPTPDVVLAVARRDDGFALRTADRARRAGLPVVVHAEEGEAVSAALAAGLSTLNDFAAAIYAAAWAA